MLDILRKMLGKSERVVVGIVTGDLHDDWQRLMCDRTMIKLENGAKKETFSLEFVKRHIVDGKFTLTEEEMNEQANAAFETEHADHISMMLARIEASKLKQEELWTLTREKLGLDADQGYEIDITSGKVYVE